RFVFTRSVANRALPPFPTRRSSDLDDAERSRAELARASIAAHDEIDVERQRHRRPWPHHGRREAIVERQAAEARDLHEVRRVTRSEEHTSELQSQSNLVCRLLLEKK